MAAESWGVDRALVDKAEREESAQIVEGKTDEGVNVLVIVATGATAGLLKKLWFDLVFPEYRKFREGKG